jgi:Ankyrin repeats (3 copies)
MKIENDITKLRVDNNEGISPILRYYDEIDSTNFCSLVFGMVKGAAEEKVLITKNAELKLKLIRKEAYQNLLDTVIAACNAASAGDIEELKKLRAKGVDLNQGDYDNRTPLHVACGAGFFEVA